MVVGAVRTTSASPNRPTARTRWNDTGDKRGLLIHSLARSDLNCSSRGTCEFAGSDKRPGRTCGRTFPIRFSPSSDAASASLRLRRRSRRPSLDRLSLPQTWKSRAQPTSPSFRPITQPPASVGKTRQRPAKLRPEHRPQQRFGDNRLEPGSWISRPATIRRGRFSRSASWGRRLRRPRW